MKYDLIVIGGGISGLFASLLAVKQNKKCLLIERAPYLGGSIRGYFHQGEYFHFGLSLLGSLQEGELLEKTLKYLELWDQVDWKDFPEKEMFTVFCDGKRMSIPSERDSFLNFLLCHYPDEKENILQFFSVLKEVQNKNKISNLDESDNEDILDFFLNSDDTVWDRLQCVKNFELKKILFSFTFLFGVLPGDTPLFVYGHILNSYLSGTKYINGGGIKLVQAMEKQLNKLGVEIRKNEEVQKFNCEDKIVQSVLTNKGEYSASEIIYTGEPKHLLKMINQDQLNKRFIRKMENYEVGLSIYGSYYEVTDDSKVDPDDFYRCFVCVDGQDIPMTLDDLRSNTIDEMLKYLSFFTNNDNGKLHIYAVLPDDGKTDHIKDENYYQLKKAYEEKIKERIEILMPQLKGKLKPLFSFTPTTIKDYLHYTDGGIFGIYASTKQKGLNSIFPFTPVKNLTLAGQNIFLPGVMGCLASVLIILSKIYGKELFAKIHQSS